MASLVLTDMVASITELKANPMAVIREACNNLWQF